MIEIKTEKSGIKTHISGMPSTLMGELQEATLRIIATVSDVTGVPKEVLRKQLNKQIKEGFKND